MPDNANHGNEPQSKLRSELTHYHCPKLNAKFWTQLDAKPPKLESVDRTQLNPKFSKRPSQIPSLDVGIVVVRPCA
jgi:hypothetical protein